jgi:hypothetical protein
MKRLISRSVPCWARDRPERKFNEEDNTMKYSAPRIINCLNAKHAIQSIKDPLPPNDNEVGFHTASAYQSDE